MRRAGTSRRVGRVLAPLAGSGALFGGVLAYLANRVVAVRRRPRYRHRLLAVGEGELVFARDRETERPGTYGCGWPGGHGVIGDVLHQDGSTVVRPLLELHEGRPVPGKARLDHVHVGDPRSALGLEFEEVTLESDVGRLPGWLVPGPRTDAWVLLAHGYGGSLGSSLSFLPLLHDLGLPALVVAYRNDPGAPPSPDGRYHLGESEWRDLDAGIAYALAHGAEQVALFGWSMGGAVALRALELSQWRDRVACLVLDSPVLDWRAPLLHVGRRSRVPAPLSRLAMSLVQRRYGIVFDELDWVARAAELDRPLLVFHGEGDDTVPVAESRELARRRPDLVELVLEPAAGHVGSWNVDPPAYRRALGDFLDRHLPASVPEPRD